MPNLRPLAPAGGRLRAALKSAQSPRVLAVGAAAAAAGALALTHHLLARRSEARHPARGKFVTVDGVQLHYLEQGAGPAIVLLHGNGVSAEDFRVSGLLDALSANHRVIAFDRPGYGYSQRPRRRVWTAQAQARLLLRALAALRVEAPLVVGHSWGSIVAGNLALEAPHAVSGLVLMSGYYRPTARPDVPLMAGPAVPVIGDLMRFTVSPILGRLLMPLMLKHLFAPAPVAERFKRDYPTALSLRPSQLRASAAESMLMPWEAARLKRRLPGLATRTLVLAGRDDKLISFGHQSEWLAGQLAGSRFLGVAGAGHMVHYTAPDEVASAIERFAADGQAPGVRTAA